MLIRGLSRGLVEQNCGVSQTEYVYQNVIDLQLYGRVILCLLVEYTHTITMESFRCTNVSQLLIRASIPEI